MRIHSLGQPAVSERASTLQTACSEESRAEILGRLQESVDLQEDSKAAGLMSVGLGPIFGAAAATIHPALGVAVGVAIGAVGLGAAVYAWRKSGMYSSRRSSSTSRATVSSQRSWPGSDLAQSSEAAAEQCTEP